MATVNVYANELDLALDSGVVDCVNDSRLATIQALYPPGDAWPQDNGLNIAELQRGLSYEYTRIDRRVQNLIDEIYPDTTYELLPDYERIWDLNGFGKSIEQRRAALIAKMVGAGDPNITNIKALLGNVGYPTNVVDTPVRLGDLFTCDSNCDASLYGAGWLFWWRAIFPSGTDDQGAADALYSISPLHTILTPIATEWSANTIGGTNSNLCLAYSPDLHVWCAITSTTSAVSSDGENWTQATILNHPWESICWASGLKKFFAVANDGAVASSTDGLHWALCTSPISISWRQIIWAAELNGGTLVAIGASGSQRVITSTDGVTFIARSPNPINWFAIAWSPLLGKLVAVAQATTLSISTSNDGVTWSSPFSGPEATLPGSIIWSPTLAMFIVGIAGNALFNGHNVWTSIDGTTFVARMAPQNQWYSISDPNDPRSGALSYNADLNLPIIAVGNDGAHACAMQTTDGINWSVLPIAPINWKFTTCAWAPNVTPLCPLFLALGSTNANVTGSLLYSATEIGE